MPAGGSLHISTEIALLNDAAARGKDLQRAGSYVLLAFSDTGTGMTEKVRQRIFEPFFTTKELGRGTGLGLSIVYGIVKQHEGQINVYSEPGQGTSFRIYLPLASTETQTQPSDAEPSVRGGSETILLAEDDEQVRAIARIALEGAGYRVLTAEDGEAAVELFRKHADEVQLCLFDLIMPRKNGKQAVAEIRRLRPKVRTLFMSGYAADLVKTRDLADEGARVLDKPLAPGDLLKHVRDALDA
jgi:CheY-like chemotaxis protein